MNTSHRHAFLSPLLILALTGTTYAQGGRNVQIKTTQVSEHVYMLVGQEGNLGVCVGEDGVFMIDDQYAPLTGKILAAVAELSESPVQFVVNTHWHGDHVGGNENLAGEGAIIVAHENVRVRMSSENVSETFNRTTPPSPDGALPVITFSEEMTFHYNGDAIEIFHVEHAHTDGDAIVHFREANVFHMGDTFFNGLYPFIDVDSGGHVDGMIATAELVLSKCDANTKIIPGHGPLTDAKGLKAYRDMLKEIRDNVAKLMKQGKSLDEIVEAKPGANYDEELGGAFINPAQLVGLIHRGLMKDED